MFEDEGHFWVETTACGGQRSSRPGRESTFRACNERYRDRDQFTQDSSDLPEVRSLQSPTSWSRSVVRSFPCFLFQRSLQRRCQHLPLAEVPEGLVGTSVSRRSTGSCFCETSRISLTHCSSASSTDVLESKRDLRQTKTLHTLSGDVASIRCHPVLRIASP